MARYDKYDPISGGFRAPLNADWAVADYGVPIGVGLNATGRVVKGAGVTGVLGVLVVDGRVEAGVVKSQPKKAGDIVDVMTQGEIVDVASLNAGTAYVANTTTFFLLVINIVYAFFDTFGIIDAMTSGGAPASPPPSWSTRCSWTASRRSIWADRRRSPLF